MYDFSVNSLKGYAIAPIHPAKDDGVGMAGSRNPASPANQVHFMATNNIGALLTSVQYQFGYDEARAISLTNVEKGKFALTVQLHKNGGVNRVGVLLLDAGGNVLSAVTLDQGPLAAMKNLYPLHSIVHNKVLYICGYAIQGAAYPSDPTFLDQKKSFLLSYDLATGAVGMKHYNTAQYIAPIPFPYPGGYNDYDMANRLKVMNGRLYLLGSANGASYSYTPGYPTYYISSGKAWVAEIDPTTLMPVTQSFFGKDQTLPYVTPLSIDGSFGVDIVEDKETPGEFYVLNNSMTTKCWLLSHMDHNLTITTPMYGFSSVSYGSSGSLKGFGAFNVPNTTTNRVSLYGMVGDNVPLAVSGLYGTVIEPITSGAVPFAMGMDLSYDPMNGVSWNLEHGFLAGNAIGYATGLNYEAPFFTQSGMGEWCTIPFAIQANPAGGNSDLQIAGHISLSPSTGNLQPRFIRGDKNGKVVSCNASQTLDLSALAQVGLQDYPTTIKDDAVKMSVKSLQVVNSKLSAKSEWTCSATNVYRTAKPALTEAAQEGISLYPNPATNEVNIRLGNAGSDAAVVLILTDITGKTIWRHEAHAAGDIMPVALPKLVPGLYHATISCDGQAPVVRKLVIQ